MLVLTINAGSSSIKYQLFDMKQELCLARGLVDRVGSGDGQLRHDTADGKHHEADLGDVDHRQALQSAVNCLTHPEHGVLKDISEIRAVGHRVVHGGEAFVASTEINKRVEQSIEDCAKLAPLHNPPNLMGIRACRHVLPDVPHVAVFDTTFHQSLPKYAFHYAIPYELYKQHGIRRYGFHGTSYRYVCGRVAELMDKPLDSLKVIACHLGNGCSMAAVRYGKCVDTSMGLTPLEGLVMGTRSGDLDLGVVSHLVHALGMTQQQADDLMNRRSGLLGLSGLSSDVRDLEEEMRTGNEQAELALKLYSYRVRKYIGAYAAALGGVDVVIFTGGVGENSAFVRTESCANLDFIGLVLDCERNLDHTKERPIHSSESRVQVWVVPTNEELVIARDTLRIAIQRL